MTCIADQAMQITALFAMGAMKSTFGKFAIQSAKG